jgi:DNA-binding MarR family transcriptional regulator
MDYKKIEKLSELICTLARYCSAKENKFAESFNLTPSELRLLKYVSLDNNKKFYTIKELKENLSLSAGRITQIISSLEKKNLIKRVSNENDRRNIELKLLPKSASFLKNLKHSYLSFHLELLEHFKEAEVQRIEKLLEELIMIFSNWLHKLDNTMYNKNGLKI